MSVNNQQVSTSQAVLDTRQFPVVILSELGVLSDAERARIMEELEGLLQRPQRHGILIDLTRSAPIPDEQCIYIAETFQTQRRLISEKWTGIALLIGKPLLAQTKLAAFWQRVSPIPTSVFSELGGAMRWLRASEASAPFQAGSVRKAK